VTDVLLLVPTATSEPAGFWHGRIVTLRSETLNLGRAFVMKALTIKQPWVHAILHEGKDIENRSWQRNFRGWLAIHASARPSTQAGFPRGHHLPDLNALDYSAICGVARVVDIVTASRSKWFSRPDDGSVNFGWVLADATPLKNPIPCKGALGLWTVAPKQLREIQRQLPRLKLVNDQR
jgi:hypothetical protein